MKAAFAVALSIAVASVSFVLPAQASEVSGATISGKVQAKNGNASLQDLVGVTLQIEQVSTTDEPSQPVADFASTAMGYSYDGLQPGTYRIFISHGLNPLGNQPDSQNDFAAGQFAQDANGASFTTAPVYRYFKVGSLTRTLTVDLLAKSKLDTGAVSGVLKDQHGAPLFDGPESSRVNAQIEILNSVGELQAIETSNSAGEFSATLNVGEYYARVGCGAESLIKCQYFGGFATLVGSTPFTVAAGKSTNNIDFSALTLKQFSVLTPMTTYSTPKIYEGQTVVAIPESNFTESPKVTYQWYVLNQFQAMLGETGTAVPGATSDRYTLPSDFNAGISEAVAQMGLLYAEVTYSLDGFATVRSTFSQTEEKYVLNIPVSAKGWKQPTVLKQAKVNLVKVPKPGAKLTLPVLKNFSGGAASADKVMRWYLCTSDSPAYNQALDEIVGGGCKVIPQKYQISATSTTFPNGYKGKYLVAAIVVFNYFDHWSGMTKPIKLK